MAASPAAADGVRGTMRAQVDRFLTGPSIHDDCSGLLVAVDLAGLPAADRPAAAAQGARVLSALRLAPAAVDWDAALARGAAGLAALLARLTEALLRPLCVLEPRSSIVAIAENRPTLFVRCETMTLGLLGVECAGNALAAALGGDAEWAGLVAARASLRAAARHWALDPTAAALAREAHRREIPWYRVEAPARALQLGQGAHRRLLLGSASDANGAAAALVARDRLAARRILWDAGIPVPATLPVASAAAAMAAAGRLGLPVRIASPSDEAPESGALAATPEELRAACEAAAHGGAIIVEKVPAGRRHLALVVDRRLVSLVRLLRPQVLGDGQRSVAALVAAENRDPRRQPGCDQLLLPMRGDGAAARVLAEQGLSLDGIPAAGQRVWLGQRPSFAAGGAAIDAAAGLHPDNRRMLEDAVATLGLATAEVALAIDDVARPWRESGGAVVGVEPQPDLRPHLLAGPARRVAAALVDALVPAPSDGRIPTCGITGSMGKTTTANMVARILAGTGLVVGRCTSVGVTVGETLRRAGDLAGGRHARPLLLDPGIEAGVFELARGGLLRDGMVVDDVEVGAVLNVLDHHIGSMGIASRADLARIKGLVARHSRRALVLNGEDEMCLAMRRETPAGRLWLVGREGAPALAAHIAEGGAAVALQGTGSAAAIMLVENGAGQRVVAADEIPATLGGRHEGKVWNAMFATAIAYAMGAPLPAIRRGLCSFKADLADSQGRLSLVERHGLSVLFDRSLSSEKAAALAAVVPHIAVPGRRNVCMRAPVKDSDAMIRAVGRTLAGLFDHYVCTNHWAKPYPNPDPDRVPRLLREGLLEGGVAPEAIVCVADDRQGTREAVAAAAPGDLLVLNTLDPDHALALIDARAAAPG
jgi:cyanophycin synthetase